ncbi:hypothetical protein FQN49_007208 [Arthroderma sp. PD_2]|nr:hypothetical protein FQN49_007208 [Arthroderma sp. PD_2]
MKPNEDQGIFAPLARIAQLEERNVQLNKSIDDLQTQLLREMARQGVAIPSSPIEYTEPSGTLQDLKRIVKYFQKKDVAGRLRILEKRALLKLQGEKPADSDEEMQDDEDGDESQYDDEEISEDEATANRVIHELTHGGDIVDDIEAIQYAENKGLEALSEFKADFAKAYNISFNAAVEVVKTSPIELLTTFNALASVREYPRWQKDEARADRVAIEHIATHIIEAALLIQGEYRAALFGLDGILEKQYHCMQETYLHRIIGIRK